ncbi:MAG: hypothetical protein F4Y44_03530 [Chloroflexi bacterium]|nr:hypothetical protein [Chloroflexota bacterium]
MSAISTFLKNRRCAKIRSLLSAYIDGETSASESRRVQEHLSTCAECAAKLESLQATTILIGRLPQLEPPRSYALTAAAFAESAPQRRFLSFETFLGGMATAGAASLVVVLVVGLVFLGRLGFMGAVNEPAPAAAPAAPAQSMAAPALAADMPQVALAPTTAPAAERAPYSVSHTGTEQGSEEGAIEHASIDDANVEAIAETHIAAQAKSVEAQATEQSAPSEATTPVWALVAIVGAALAAAAVTAVGLMRRRATNNIDERNEQDGNN